MITLATADTISGIAGTATAVSYSLFGTELTSVETHKRLAQGQLAISVGTLYTAPASTSTLVKFIILTNTSGSAVSGITLYSGGTSASNQITGSITLPANGTVTVNNNGLHFTDSLGELGVAHI